MSDSFPSLPPDLQPEPTIHFNFINVSLPESLDLPAMRVWIERVIASHSATLGNLAYVFCDDDYLHRLNVDYLDHDTLTDIITFPYADPPQVSGDLYISAERVMDNARDRNVAFPVELRRVMIHGVLHLCGYGDKTPEEAARMRELEEAALAMWDMYNVL